ncbi:MAG TPA: flagellar biosynthesis anti-sigma factor FlgM [Bryobacteraceae bacterium]|nr:flagellar biosynthesis anti-sigma factor FlgM [Bryobacteraceae bacterium]
MSIRIQNDSLAGAATSGIGHADEISHSPGSAGSPAGRSGSRGTDSVDISSLSQNVAAASSAQQAQQAGRVKQLTALYRSGQYNVDSTQVSRAIVSQSLGDWGGKL